MFVDSILDDLDIHLFQETFHSIPHSVSFIHF